MLSLLLACAALGPAVARAAGPAGEAAASCGPSSCYAVFSRRRSFLEAWRACRELGGNLATPRTADEAARLGALAARGAAAGQLLWIGLQRQPRQCHPQRPLRGFTWTTGDQDTAYTNWAAAAAPAACAALRCAAMEAGGAQAWREGSCALPADGYACQFAFAAACPALAVEEGQAGPARYTTPFRLVSEALAWLPLGSVADVPCARGGGASLLCARRPEGGVGWSRAGPVCPGPGAGPTACAPDNGGCEHECVDAGGGRASCRCADGFRLARDGRSCVDPCADAPCEQRCEPGGPGGYSCRCRLGFRPAEDEPQRCVDTDECRIPGVCQQMCVNYVGGFECYCSEGHELEPDGISCRPLGALGGATQEEEDEGEEEDEDDEEEDEEEDEEGAWDSFEGGWTEAAGPLWLDPTRSPLAFAPPYRPLLPRVSPTRPPLFIPPGSPYRPPLLSITRPPRLPPAHWLPVIPATRSPLPPPYQLPVFSATDPPARQPPPVPSSRPPRPPVPRPSATAGLPTPPAPRTTLLPAQRSPGLPAHPAREEPPASGAHHPGPSVRQPPLVSTTGPPLLSTPQPASMAAPHRPLRPALAPSAPGLAATRPSLPPPLPTDRAPRPPTSPSTSPSLGPPASPSPALVPSTPSETLAEPSPSPPTSPPLPGTSPHPPGSPPDPHQAPDRLGSSLPSPTARSRSRRDDRWLLVALLVPTCVFLVILLAVGIVYCTRCGPRAPNKSITDCYHWITNSGTKGETEPKGGSLSGVTTCRTSV